MFQKLKTFYTRFSLKTGVAFAAALLFSQAAIAQFAATPCDPNYYQSLEARAWLEAQREITQNQNLIFKPDSVLEYTCFDRHLQELADHADEMFSETNRWGPTILLTPVPQPIHMDNALTLLVGNAVSTYDASNYGASLLGGRLDGTGGWAPATAPAAASGTSYTPAATITGGSYTCDLMQAVWQKAKCMNFIPNGPAADEDGFFTFDHYANNPDKRFLPTRCTGPGAALWQTNIDTALPPPGATVPWEFDDVDTYMDHFFPTVGGCGPPGSLNRVMTGLVVQNTVGMTPPFYFEHACLVPGCHWNPTGAGTAAAPATNGQCVFP